MPQGLTALYPEEINRVYKMMRLYVLADRESRLTAEWGCDVNDTLMYLHSYYTHLQVSCSSK